MALINSLALYLLLLSVMMYASYKVNNYRDETKTTNEKRMPPGRSLLGIFGPKNAYSIVFPEILMANPKKMSEYFMTTVDNNMRINNIEMANINKGGNYVNELRLLKNTKNNPITSSSSLPFNDNTKWSLISKKTSQVSPLSRTERIWPSSTDKRASTSSMDSPVTKSSMDSRISQMSRGRRISMMPMYKRFSSTSKDRGVSLLFEDRQIRPLPTDRRVLPFIEKGTVSSTYRDGIGSPEFKINLSSPSLMERLFLPSYNKPTSPPNGNKNILTDRKDNFHKFEKISKKLIKQSTDKYLLVFDENGNLQTKMVPQPFLRISKS